MNTKKRLNCYVFSNLIISFLSLHFLINDTASTLTFASNKEENHSLQQIYQKEVITVSAPIFKSSVKPQEETRNVSSKKSKSNVTISYVKPSYNRVTGTNLVSYAKHYLGLPYVSGGNSLVTGTDCSGFTKLIFKEFGISLGRTVSSQLYSGTYVSKVDLQPGDLVFYGYSNYATHVGIYMGNGLVIHQSNPRDGVKINSVDMMVYITARRLITANVETRKEEQEEEKEKIEKQETDSILEENVVANPKEEVEKTPDLEKEEVILSPEIESGDKETSKEEMDKTEDSVTEDLNSNDLSTSENIEENYSTIGNNQSIDSIDTSSEKEILTTHEE